MWIGRTGTPRPADRMHPTAREPGGGPRRAWQSLGAAAPCRSASFFVTTTGGHPAARGKPSILRAPRVARLLLGRLAMPENLLLIVLVVALHLLVVATTE